MNVMIFDVPAEKGGALTILNEYYEKAKHDTDNQYYFVLSNVFLEEKGNVKVINFPWIKKSWFHRLFFDYFVAYKVFNKYNIDKLISLQNVLIKRVKSNQILYLHQALPFVDTKFSLVKYPRYWIYQNIISRDIFKSVKEADKVIVQSDWLKKILIKKLSLSSNSIIVNKPSGKYTSNDKYKGFTEKTCFFYPASSEVYKNHTTIYKAVENLSSKVNTKDFEVILTLKGNETREVNKIYKSAKKNRLPIKFIGPITVDKVFNYYSNSILLFPSYIETFGLPLLEAKEVGSPIIAADKPFSQEILDDYPNKNFFNHFNYLELSKIMEEKINEVKSKLPPGE